MSRTVKQDIDLLFDIDRQVKAKLNPDQLSDREMEQVWKWEQLIFENQNKWLLSDKISSEKQARMDQFKSEKGTGTPGGEEEPTQKQISYATQLGIIVEGKGYSKKELSRLIDEAVKEQKQR